MKIVLIFTPVFSGKKVCGLSDPATDQTLILTVQCHEEKEKTTNIVAYTDTVWQKYDAFCMIQECSSVLQIMWNILSSQDLHSATVCIVPSWRLRLNMRQKNHHVLCNTSSCHHVHVSQISWTRDRGSLVYCKKLSFWRMGKPPVGERVVGAPLDELRPQVIGSWSRHWHRSQITCYWRQIGEHSVLPATGGRLENTSFYL